MAQCLIAVPLQAHTKGRLCSILGQGGREFAVAYCCNITRHGNTRCSAIYSPSRKLGIDQSETRAVIGTDTCKQVVWTGRDAAFER